MYWFRHFAWLLRVGRVALREKGEMNDERVFRGS
jgi:hypothetical protein